MGAFEYSALDERGKTKKGILEGDTAKSVRQQLRDKGWMPMDINEVKDKPQRGSGFNLFNSNRSSASAGELAMLTRQLSTLVGSGTPLEETLRAVAQQTEKPKIKRVVMGVRSSVMEGHTLADAMKQFPGVFPELYCATVAAGEHTGNLDLILDRLADYTENRETMRSKVQQALVYPIILLLMAIGVVVGLVTFVVPKLVKVFESSKQELPTPTKILITVSDFLAANWMLILVALIALVILFAYAMTLEKFKFKMHQLQLKLPIISRLVRGANAARFANTFSILVGAGVPVLDALRISSEVISHLPMQAAVTEMTTRVREGSGIAKSLAESKQFPPMMVHLIANGEASGRLSEMLDRASSAQEREVDGIISTALGLMEPIIILIMGGSVFGIIISVLLPIFNMNQGF